MKDHEGYLSKGWMMHEPYCLHNGTPALALYTYLYRTTRKNEWQGSLQTLADLVEIPIRTTRRCIHELEQRSLIDIKPLGHSHYSIKALRLTRNESEEGQFGTVVGHIDTEVGQFGTEVGQIGTPIKDNINININTTKTNVSSSIGTASSASAAPHEVLDRKVYITKVLARQLPDYPYAVVYEYASLVQIPSEIVDDFLTHYASTGWKMNNGGRVENWAAALVNWHKRARRFAERDQQRATSTRSIIAHQAGQQMSEQNRAIYEAELERKRLEKEQRDRESNEALSFEEYQALKARLSS